MKSIAAPATAVQPTTNEVVMQQNRPSRDASIYAAFAAMDRRDAHVTKPAPTCDTCARFVPDPINPPAGLGTCGIGHGTFYPCQPHTCIDHTQLSNGIDV